MKEKLALDKKDSIHKKTNDGKFYMHLVNGEPQLKINHANGYYTQIQMTMGLAGLSFCDFIVYSFKGMIISPIQFNRPYFQELIR